MEFDVSTSSFLCQFSNLENAPKSCKIIYGHRHPITHRCLSLIMAQNSTNNNVSDTVTVFVPSLEYMGSDSEFCFTAIGTTGAFTVAVEGTIRTGMHNLLYLLLITLGYLLLIIL